MTNEFNITQAEIEEGKTMGGIAYLFNPIGFLVAYFTNKENKYVVYHAQQSLLLLLCSVVVGFIWGFVLIPYVGIIVGIFAGMLTLAMGVLCIMGIINGFTGEIKPIPLIGQYAFKLGLLKVSGETAPDSPDVE